MKEEFTKLLEQYKDQVAKFQEFCIKDGDNEIFEEVDFRDLSLGFFIALGVVGDSGTEEKFYDAHVLSTIVRYDLQYWEDETI